MSTRYGWDPADGPSRPFSETKVCMGCGARFWPPRGKPFADFCNDCWASIEVHETCPRKGCSGHATIDRSRKPQIVQCGAQDFWDRHGSAPRSSRVAYGNPELRDLAGLLSKARPEQEDA